MVLKSQYIKYFPFYLLFSLSLLVIFCYVNPNQSPSLKNYPDLELIFPIKGKIDFPRMNPFGEQRGNRKHLGIDIFAAAGTPIYAPQTGKIVRLTYQKAAGNYIWLLDYRGQYIYEFMHLQKFARGISPGKRIRKGDIIGYVGNTGNARGSSPHLHFGVVKLAKKEDIFGKRQYLDPMIFLQQ
jgi:murein DD-endopeptidase MepM/ murein hydrolase activator NlpD